MLKSTMDFDDRITLPHRPCQMPDERPTRRPEIGFRERLARQSRRRPSASPSTILCPVCTPHTGTVAYCSDCGYHFSAADLAQAVRAMPRARRLPPVILQNRFRTGDLLCEHPGVARYRGLDHGDGQGPAVRW